MSLAELLICCVLLNLIIFTVGDTAVQAYRQSVRMSNAMSTYRNGVTFTSRVFRSLSNCRQLYQPDPSSVTSPGDLIALGKPLIFAVEQPDGTCRLAGYQFNAAADRIEQLNYDVTQTAAYLVTANASPLSTTIMVDSVQKWSLTNCYRGWNTVDFSLQLYSPNNDSHWLFEFSVDALTVGNGF